MIAFILKDIATLKKTLAVTIISSIALALYGIHENTLFMIPLLCAMIPLILTAIAFGYDNKSNFEQLAFSMPIKKSSYVFSKLFFAVAFGLVGSICIFVLLMTKKQMPVDTIAFIAFITFVSAILISAVQLPFILKYGAEKARLIMVILYLFIFVVSELLKEKSYLFAAFMERIGKHSLAMVCLGITAVSVCMIAAAIKISIMIMEKKEY